MRFVWDRSAWDDYVWRRQQDRKVVKRINALLQDIARNGDEGTATSWLSTESSAIRAQS